MPVFVLTHHSRPALEMEGGTTFHFVTGGIHEALAAATDAADDQRHGDPRGTATHAAPPQPGLAPHPRHRDTSPRRNSRPPTPTRVTGS